MATVTKTWDFPTDAMGLAATNAGAAVSFSWVSADHAVQFSSTAKALSNSFQEADGPSTGVTWETWGVPAGATVTSTQISGWSLKLAANTGLNSARFYIMLLASGSLAVNDTPSYMINNVTLPTTPTATTFTPQAAGPDLAVLPAYQASNSQIYLGLLIYISSKNSPTVQDVRYLFDDITLAITYTPPSGGGTPAAMSPAAMLMGM